MIGPEYDGKPRRSALRRLVNRRLVNKGTKEMKVPLVLAAALLLVLFTGIASADVCIVQDPTGTPLNVRKRPSQHAPIIGALNNGITVSTRMWRGDWAHIVPHEAPGKSGWVWRKFIDCPTPEKPEKPPSASETRTLDEILEGAGGAIRRDKPVIPGTSYEMFTPIVIKWRCDLRTFIMIDRKQWLNTGNVIVTVSGGSIPDGARLVFNGWDATLNNMPCLLEDPSPAEFERFRHD
jgi:hypothetical protein